MKVTVDYQGNVDVPFQDLLDNPKLVLHNMPRVQSIEKVGEMDYRVTSKPYALHAGIIITGIAHVNLDVVDGEIVWSHSDNHDHKVCNGIIEGVARRNGDGSTFLKGTVTIEHVLATGLMTPFIKPLARKLSKQMIEEFRENFHDPVYENNVPD